MDALSLIAEQRIQDATAKGVFDDLPGRGKALELEDDSAIPEDLRMAYKILKNSGYVPPELEYRKEAQTIVELLEHCTDVREKVRQMRRLDVVMAKIEKSRGKTSSLKHSAYYTQIVSRLTLPEKN